MTWYEWAAIGCAAVTVYALIIAFFVGRGRLIDGLRRYQQQAAIRGQVHDIVARLERHDDRQCGCYDFDVEPRYVEGEIPRLEKQFNDTPFDQEQP